MNHASWAVTPLDPETVQVGDAIGQRAKRRGLVQCGVGTVGVLEVLVLARHGPVQQLSPTAADLAFHDRTVLHRQLHLIRTIGTDGFG
jgi:hypothetical protein